MSQPPPALELPVNPGRDSDDPDLLALPAPRRPGRRLTLVIMTLTMLLALWMAVSLRSDAAYALAAGPPEDLGNLAKFDPDRQRPNQWVRGEGLLSATRAIRYGRPLERGTYRLAQLEGNERLWVQIRVPAGMEGPRFVPPSTFVGRLLPVEKAGLRHWDIENAVAEAGQEPLSPDAWLLLDGEAPSTTRWALGLVALFLGFAAFNIYGLVHLLRPVHDS
jgi:hypothetical protein